MLCNANGAAAGAAAAVRRGESLVKIEVHDVKAHVSWAYNAHQGVHVGAVIVQKAAAAVHKGCNLLDLGLKQAQGIGICHHNAGDIRAKKGFQSLHVNASVLKGLHLHHLQATHCGRCRVGSVGAVRDDDLGAGKVSSHHMVLTHYHKAGEFTVCSGAGVEGKGVHAGYGGKGLVHLLVHLEGAFGKAGVHEGMKPRKALKGRDFLVDLGIVLHGTGAKRIEAGVNAEVHLGEVGVVTDNVRFTYLRQFQGRFTPQGSRDLCACRERIGREGKAASAFL